MPGVSAALSLLACAKCTFFARKAAGAFGIRPSLRPCVLEICQNMRTGGCIRTARCWN
jgi:hypothetical protein